VNNGLLPARVSEADGEALIAAIQGGTRELSIDLEAETVSAGEFRVGFMIDPVWRTKLLNGWDDIDLTLSHGDAIESFARGDAERRSWVYLERGASP